MKRTLKEKWQTFTFSERFTAIASVGGIIVSVVSLAVSMVGLYLVIKSLKSSEEIASTSTYLQTYAWTIDVDKAFIEHPDLKDYLYGDTSELNKDSAYNANKTKVKAMAELVLDSYDAILNNTNYFKIHPDDEVNWMQTVEDNFKRSTILSKYFGENCQFYGPKLNSAYLHK